jgi:hypothetical protein
VNNYLSNIGKGKDLQPPFVFQGGVSKNVGVVRAFENAVGHSVIVDDCGHLMGALGVALIAAGSPERADFSFAVQDIVFETLGEECGGCPNDCEVVLIVREGRVIDGWGNRCAKGFERAKSAAGAVS